MSSPKAPSPKGVAELLQVLPAPAKQKLKEALNLFVDPNAKPQDKNEDPLARVKELAHILRRHSSSSD